MGDHRRYRQTVQTATGYEEQERVVDGPLYHGGRPNRGGQITRGRQTNSWGDEGGKSTHNYFTTDLETARQYAEQIPHGRVYQVEPTGPIKKDYAPADYKSPHPLRIVREVPREEWMGRTAALDLPDGASFHFTPSPVRHADHALELHAHGQQIGRLSWGHDGDISGVDTHPQYRRRGVATALYTRAHELAHQHGIAPPGGSVFQTPAGHAFREHFDALAERPDVSRIPTSVHRFRVTQDDLREHLIHDHGMQASADLIRGASDEKVRAHHDRLSKVDPCGWGSGEAKTASRGVRREHGWTYEKHGPGALFPSAVRAIGPNGEEDSYYGTGLTQVRHPRHLPGPMYHGTRREIPDGAQIEPGHPGNFVRRMKHVYMTSDLEEARHYAGPSGHVFEVRPTGFYGHRADAKGTSWASEDPLDIVDRVPHGPTTKTAASDAERLSFSDPEEEFTGGSKWPNEGYIRAQHPEHGEVGYVHYLRGSRVNSPLMIKMLRVHPDHRRKGYGSALMDQLQRAFPKAKINHGDRTDQGKAWWNSYGQGADRRGRTGTLTSGRTASVCPCGMKVIKDGNEWVHADGSVSHDGAFYGRSVADLMRVAAELPTRRLFGPTYGLDHRLFDGDQLRPDVTHYVLGTLDGFWRPLYGAGWRRWARVYLAGSEASEWTSETLEGNNDFDVLVGVHYDRARADVPAFAGLTDEDITAELNHGFREHLIPRTDPTTITIDGQPTGPWSNTWFCNPDSYSIADIKPYAAYDVTNHSWAVRPPHLPDWSIDKFPEGHALVEMGEAYEKLIAAIFDLPEPYRTQQGNALWTYLHSDRARAFGPQGEGWWDPGNVIEKWLDQKGIWADLWAIHHDADQHPEHLLAPAGWSNDPGQ